MTTEIKKLVAFDLDNTLMCSIMPEEGKKIWKEKTNTDYPHLGWWGRKESLNTEVFDIKLFPTIVNLIKRDCNNLEAYVIILTSRIPRLEPEIQKILTDNGINVDNIDTKKDYRTKGQRLMTYVNQMPDLEEINLFDDEDHNIEIFLSLKDQINKNIKYNVYKTTEGNIQLIYTNNKLMEMINEEILKL
jgi:hypothetical protein